MARYRRMTYGDRCQIQAYLQVELPVSEIAAKLCFDKSTIYRELGRNRGRAPSYGALHAEKLSKVRFRSCRRQRTIRGSLSGFVQWRLCEGWSPQQISNRLRSETGQGPSHQTIYRYALEKRGQFKFCLRRYNKRGYARYTTNRRTTRGLSIRERPHAANARSRIGDWERDTLFIFGRKKLLVCADRKSRYMKLAKVNDPTAKGVTELTEKLLKQAGKRIYTVTNDNNTEFNGGSILGCPVYYCDPLKPQQRGMIENLCGLLRQYFTHKTNINDLSEQDIRDVEQALNHRPRKCLDYKTPYEVFYGKSVALAM